MSILSTALKFLGKKGIIGAIDVDRIVEDQYKQVQSYQNPYSDFKTPMQLISSGVHYTADGVADTIDQLIPGQFFDDIVTFPLRKADGLIQLGTRFLDPLVSNFGKKIGTKVGNKILSLKESKNSKTVPSAQKGDPNGSQKENYGKTVQEEKKVPEQEEVTRDYTVTG